MTEFEVDGMNLINENVATRSWLTLAGAMPTGRYRWIEATYITSAATFSARADAGHPPPGIRTAPISFSLDFRHFFLFAVGFSSFPCFDP